MTTQKIRLKLLPRQGDGDTPEAVVEDVNFQWMPRKNDFITYGGKEYMVSYLKHDLDQVAIPPTIITTITACKL